MDAYFNDYEPTGFDPTDSEAEMYAVFGEGTAPSQPLALRRE